MNYYPINCELGTCGAVFSEKGIQELNLRRGQKVTVDQPCDGDELKKVAKFEVYRPWLVNSLCISCLTVNFGSDAFGNPQHVRCNRRIG